MIPPDEEDDDDNYDIVNEEADEAMAVAAPPGVGDLPPEYQAILAASYVDDALLQHVLEASKADEDAAFPGYDEAIALTGMMAEHIASFPPRPDTPLLAAYDGQEVPPPPSVLCRQHRHDHTHRVVINPPPQPQTEVIIDLVSDDEE
jgi:hypothetical protein